MIVQVMARSLRPGQGNSASEVVKVETVSETQVKITWLDYFSNTEWAETVDSDACITLDWED